MSDKIETSSSARILELKKQREESRQAYYSLRGDVYRIKDRMQCIAKHRGQSDAFKLLIIALDVFNNQIDLDRDRYENRLTARETKFTVAELQQSLNRERAKRQQLEAKIKEASESSGLFIKYVRKALKVGV